MRPRFPLFAKILVWFFVNLLALGVVFLVFFNLQLSFSPGSPLFAASGSRLLIVARLINDELRAAVPTDRAAILQRYSESYKVDFLLVSDAGEDLAELGMQVPAEVRRFLAEAMPPGPSFPLPPQRGFEGRPPGPRPPGMPPPAPRPDPIFRLKTSNPTRYWAGVRMMLFEREQFAPVRATLLAVSDSISGHGLFFDPKPWLYIASVVLVLSILLWFPFVRSLTRSVAQMTAAAEQIAEEHFDVRVNARRSDELGRLGAAINRLAERLAGFVGGQKRFLGSISHELNSPLARMQFALSILEEQQVAGQRSYISDAQEEVRLMSELVSELLAFAKAGMKSSELKLVGTPLLPLVRRVCEREAAACGVRIEIDETAAALAQPELLSRALANVVRNAVRYAAGTGQFTIAAERRSDQIRLTVADRGPGVPPDALEHLFEPFYRLEPDRARATGGSGLGLAIAKTCVEACRGTVAAHNLSPSGLEIAIVLQGAPPL